MKYKRKKRRGAVLKRYAKNEAYVKGLIFESIIKELTKKAGFCEMDYFQQYNIKKTGLHGRGARHQIDVMGVFKLGIPFVNPIFLVAEAKNFNRKVRIEEVRDFLGKYIDIVQFNRVNTKTPQEIRYTDILQPRVTYRPVFFSMKGFVKSAEELMFAHGISYFSYENSAIMKRISKLVNQQLKQIKFSKLVDTDFKIFKEVEQFKNLRMEVKRQNYDKVVDKINSYLLRVNSYIGVLDKNFPIHILTTNKRVPKKHKEIKLELENDTNLIIKSIKNIRFGQFSLPKHFIQAYVKFAKKQNRLSTIFKQIDLVLPIGNTMNLVNLKINDSSRKELIDKISGYNEQ
ncbi:MAG: hypothetical protein QXF56_05150 [Candidatus Micrarchaeia archaeon]